MSAMEHRPIDSTRKIGVLGRLEAICLGCGEPIVWSDDHKEWHTTAREPAGRYLDVCSNCAAPTPQERPNNVIQHRNGALSAVCEFCGRVSRATLPTTPGRLHLWEVGGGWSVAPYPVGFVHSDGSTGDLWTCPPCGRRLDRGEGLYSRREPRQTRRTRASADAAGS